MVRRSRAIRPESEVASDSLHTYVFTIKIMVDNWREWNGVPFYPPIQAGLIGKAKFPSPQTCPSFDVCRDDQGTHRSNTVVMRIQPDGGSASQFQAKIPRTRLCLEPVIMDFSYQRFFLNDYELVCLIACGDRISSAQ
jgi:glucose-6-phosphate 1-dehydrogenase